MTSSLEMPVIVFADDNKASSIRHEFFVKNFPQICAYAGGLLVVVKVFPDWHSEANTLHLFSRAARSNTSMTMKRAAQKLREANIAGVALLIADAEKALVDLDMVRTASSVEDQNRIIEEVLQAYNAILDRLPRFTVSAEQLVIREKRISELRQQLIEAGRIKDRRRKA